MERLNDYRMRLVFVGFLAAVIVSGGSTKADFTIGEITNIGAPVNTASDEEMPSISADGLELYFQSRRPGGYTGFDIWVAKRASLDDLWGEPVNLGPLVNSGKSNWSHGISADGLELYFEAARDGNIGSVDIWVAVRETKDDPWGEPVNLGPTINSSSNDACPNISTDGLELYFRSNRPGQYGYHDLWVCKRPTTEEPWGNPVNLGPPISTPDTETYPSISADGLALFFNSDRLNGARGWDKDIWMTRRKTKESPWGEPINLGPGINTPYNELAPSISSDGRTLYFSDYYWSNIRPGGHGGADIYQVSITPIVDLNGDGFVDVEDVVILTDHWGTNETLCDIGPMPWGDGIVDVQDLLVLTEYIEPEIKPLVFWGLDESEGILAKDSAGENDATVFGNPVWQPTGGKVGGALEFDGIDDYISTSFVLNPGKESFSVFAWINGGAPGQVILSQVQTTTDTPVGPVANPGTNWVGVNQSDGGLMTGLMDTFFGTLESNSTIIDGQWHHVGLVYDINELKRYLYVDGAEVAVDSGFVGGLQTAGELYIGAGQDLDSGTFWSGHIDDVRIYNRALSAEEIAKLAH